MKKIILFVLFLSVLPIYSQDTNQKLEVLKKKESNLVDQLSTVRQEIKVLEDQIAEIKFNELSKEGFIRPLATSAKFFLESNLYSQVCAEKEKGEEVLVIGSENSMWKVAIDNKIAYTTFLNIDDKELFDRFVDQENQADNKANEIRLAQEEKENKKKAAAYKAKQQREREAHLKAMIDKYGKEEGKLIAEKKVHIGMTKEMALDAWGKPKDINRSTYATFTTEQWVYGSGNYLYFRNGILETIQN